MPPHVPNPHDALFRKVFRVPRYAAGLLRIVLPPELLGLLDLERIEVLEATHVSPELRGSASDIVLKVGRRGPAETSGEPASAFITFAVEHQSRDERFITLRQLHYATRLWDDWLRDHAGATHLPLIIPVVIHTGATPWRSPTTFHALLDLPAPPLDALLRPFLPDFRVVLEDLATDPLERLREAGDEPVSETVLEIMQNAPGPAADALFNRWLTQLAPLRTEPGGPSTLAAVLCYLFYVGAVPRERVVQAAEELPAPAKEEFMTIAEQYFEEGVQKGLEKGLERGRQEGEHLALASVLLRLAALRFGPLSPEAAARIQAASTPELERWLEAILTAERLNDLFE